MKIGLPSKTGYAWLFFVLLSLCSCSPKRPEPPMPPQESAALDDYLLGPEDIIEVLVWKNPDISRVVTIRPDGKVSLPLIGDVKAAGLNTVNLAQEITEQLKQFYKEPASVTVIVQQVNSYVIYIAGEVRNPGKFVVKSSTTFVQAITLAGGFTEFASPNKVILLRKSAEEQKEMLFKIKYRDILSGQQNNIMLKPNDNIIVP